jgi:ATP-binding cassette subfamily B protein/subfamily B ATP-binding cassette protein MsbA
MPQTSRQRYEAYREKVRARRADPSMRDDGSRAAAKGGVKQRSRTFVQLFRQFLKFLGGHRGVLAVALVLSGVATLVGLIPLYGTKVIIDNVLGDEPLDRSLPAWVHAPSDPRSLLIFVTVAMLVFAVISLSMATWSRWHATRISKRVQMGVRRRVFDQAVNLPLHRVYEIKSGGAASILREDAGAVGDLLFAMLFNPWKAIVQLTGTLIILAMTDWRLLIGSIVLLPTVYVSHKTYISRIRPMFRDIRFSRQQIDSHATEAFGGIRVVRGFSRQRTESQRFITNNHMMARQELHTWWWNRGIEIAWAVIIPAATAVVMLYGGLRVLGDAEAVKAGTLSEALAFTTGDLVMFLAYLGALLNPLALLASSAAGFQTGLAGLDRVLDLLDEPRELPTAPDAIDVDEAAVHGRITLTNVGYTYPGGKTPVLCDVNLDIQAGEMVAFVGPSGAGKTTLSNIIARFYAPTEGTIALDGIDLNHVRTPSYRRLLGIVEQDIFLFDGTVAENIAYGGHGVTQAQIIEAARRANAHLFIDEFKDGYRTIIGERGVRLSGGQRQRIAIARALLADPRILILDEATSNLDTESERLIQSSLRTLMKGRTSIVIAHRLSTIQHADRIVVIEGGQVVEHGRHDELMARSGRYREMVEVQTRPPEVTADEDEVQTPVEAG